MQPTAISNASIPLPPWREVVWPKEHGSWSLALEPVALGLLASPSLGGGALALAAVAGFFTRRPIRIALYDAKPPRRVVARRAAILCAAIAAVACVVAVIAGGFGWLRWLVPAALAGVVFLAFDLQRAGREQAAEVAGAAAFAWLPAAFAALAGWPAASAAALGLVMVARALPTVLTVRASVRGRKTGEWRPTAAVLAAIIAFGVVVALARAGLAPKAAVPLAGLLALRSFALLVFPRTSLRASTIGIAEAVIGLVYVVVVAFAWSL